MAAGGDGEAVFLFPGVIRGHHVYKALWTPVVGETVQVCREPSNPFDVNSLAVVKGGITVGHVPREVRRVFSCFLDEGSDHEISCEVTGHRKLGKGLEVPCLYIFTGKEKIIKSIKGKLNRKKRSSK